MNSIGAILARLIRVIVQLQWAARRLPAKLPEKIAKASPGARVTIGGAVAALAITLVGQWEGLRTTAYRDIVGVPTICYGETKGVRMGTSRTKAECDAMLMNRLAEFEAGLDRCLTVEDRLPNETKVSLVSWSYNIGTGAACKSTLVRLANTQQWQAMCDQLPRWNRAGGRVVRGLTNRRAAEREMCLRGLRQAGMIR